MKTASDIIIRPIITEQSMEPLATKKYDFSGLQCLSTPSKPETVI